MAKLLSLDEAAKTLNMSKDEIMELVRQKRIPHLYFPDKDEYAFPDTEILDAITPRPKSEEPSPFPKKENNEPVVPRRGRKKQT